MKTNPVVEHIPRLRRYARALTRDHHAVEDLVQDTLERALNKIHLWRPGSDLRAWLFSVMHNVFLNQLRGPRFEPGPDPDSLPDPTGNAEHFDRIELAELDQAMRCLAPEQRDVLMLVAVEEMSYVEAARTLGIPPGTVMSRLSRAREKLQQLTGYEPQKNGTAQRRPLPSQAHAGGAGAKRAGRG
ncbi:MAG: RNA polymerase sigma factor [Burkholderiales bacterium]|nr:RNA polymerase sigma factor [Burkholderiales bacterium]